MRILVLTGLLLGLLACDSPVIFEHPQPAGSPPEASFRSAYQGSYLCTADSTVMVIGEDLIYSEYSYILHHQWGDSTEAAPQIRRETTVGEFGPEVRYFLRGESLPLEQVIDREGIFVGRVIHRDTLFQIADDQVLTYFRGYQLLNYLHADGFWEVCLLQQLPSGDVELRITKAPEDMQQLQAITPVSIRPAPNNPRKEQIILSPSRSEFRKLLRKGDIFEDCGYYERMPDYHWSDILF